jgi:outer membrane protein assembly factor BamB
MYQHDPSHHAAAGCADVNELTVAGLHPAWFMPTAQPVTASPVVSGGQLYVGDNSGVFYDVNAATGKARWTFDFHKGAKNRCGTVDRHDPSYGEITSSAAVAQVPGFADGDPTVFFGAGGSAVALDAATGTCRWATDLDPSNPTSPLEEESSPVVFLSGPRPEVIVGSDGNESPKQSGPTGLQALDALTGALLWKFEPENDTTVTSLDAPVGTTSGGAPDTSHLTDGCGDVWSSPALAPRAPRGLSTVHGSAVRVHDGLVVTTTGNCPQGLGEDPATPVSPKAGCAPKAPLPTPNLEGMAALDATTGCLVWRWTEPVNQYSNPALADGGDTDIGSSPILTTVRTASGPQAAVIDGSKSGYMYALSETAGTTLWASQPAEPGQTGAALAGAIGGFIGSSALGIAGGRPTVFGATAILAPFSGAGVQFSGPAGLPEVTPDTTVLADPTRLASLHAVDAATGAVRWQALVSLPSYAAVTYSQGVVFAPSTTGFSLVAYDAGTGLPLWAFPTGASMSSAAAVVGPSVFVGAGTDQAPGVPPQTTGIWRFTLSSLPT